MRLKECHISVISPVYRAEKMVKELIDRVVHEITAITQSFEIILVEDGSPDKSWEIIEECCKNDNRIKGIKLSRNFGQHFAITAGIENARGEFIVVMDCDLQDDPIYIKDLYKKAQEGFDIVYTFKKKRQHALLKNFFALVFHWIMNQLIENKNWRSDKNVGSFSLINSKVSNAFCRYNDYRRHYLMVLRWLGFRSTYIEIEHRERFEGNSSYSFSKLILHAIDGITSQSDKLLRINIFAGILISFLSFIFIVTIVVLYFTVGFLSGWASLIIAILFSTGVVLTSVGITGIYIGKTFEQAKDRPKYIIDQFLNQIESSYEMEEA